MTLRPLLLTILLLSFSTPLLAQIPRERAQTDRPEEIFWAPSLILTSTVTNLPQGNLNFTIMHTFGVVSNGAEDLFGLDGAANIRFGLDYGVTDRLSIGFGRSRFDKLYDFRFKANLLRQTSNMPLELAVKGDVGITTMENGFDFNDRLSYLAAVLVARKFSDKLSLQLTPMFSHFNTVFILRGADGEIIEEENDHLGVALGGRYLLSERWAIVAEYIPVFGDRSDGTTDTFSVGAEIETGGHVFQLFFTSSQWMTEQHTLARNTDDFFGGDIRWGFNVNRVFGAR